MSLKRRWTAWCHEPDCKATWVAEGAALEDRYEAGIALNDLGWQAGPGHEETYCPDHWRPEEDWDQIFRL